MERTEQLLTSTSLGHNATIITRYRRQTDLRVLTLHTHVGKKLKGLTNDGTQDAISTSRLSQVVMMVFSTHYLDLDLERDEEINHVSTESKK